MSFLITFSPNFNIHWCFLLEWMITVMVVQWWISNPIILLLVLFGILAPGRVFSPSYSFIHLFIYTSVDLMGYNPLLSWFILMLKLLQIWPVGAPISWLWCSFDISGSSSFSAQTWISHYLQGAMVAFNGGLGVCMLSHVWLFETPRTVARPGPLSTGLSLHEYWSGLPFSSSTGSSPPRDQTHV